jgi:hypothetical protein
VIAFTQPLFHRLLEQRVGRLFCSKGTGAQQCQENGKTQYHLSSDTCDPERFWLKPERVRSFLPCSNGINETLALLTTRAAPDYGRSATVLPQYSDER